MKKYIFALILGCGIVLQYQSAYAQVEDTISEIETTEQKMCGTNCTYELDNKGFLLIKPIDNLNKAYIQDSAFKGRKDFNRAKIDEGIVSIGDNAFDETNLVKAELPNTLNSIGTYAFCETKLKGITLPNSLTSIGEGAFVGAKLKKIKIPDSVSRIGARAFASNDLGEVILPKNLKVIEGGVFHDNDELVDIVIPDTVTSIECEDWYIASGAFESCEKLENVYFSKTLEHIGREAFSRTNIKELNLPKSLKTIGWYAFSEIKISELDIPDSVVFIDEGAFEETTLSYLIISDTTEVSDKAFKDAKIGTVYCRGNVEVCKENLEYAVPETTEFKSVSEMPISITDKQVDNVSSKETVEPKENIELEDDNEIVDDVETDEAEDDSVSYSVPTSETAENEKTDDIVSYNTTTAQMVDKNILADEELMKTITPEQLQDYIAKGADVNAKDESGWTVLSIAAKNTSNPEIIDILLKQNADVNDKNEYGVTALMYAAKYNENSKISEILIKYGANINDDDNDGDTALMYAAGCNDNPEVVKVLLRNGADVNVKNEDGSTALTEAFGRSNNMFNVAKGWRGQNKPNQKQLNDKIIELLIENGADTDILFSKFISLENAIVIDFDPHGVFLKTQDIDRLILYTMDKNYSNKELFKSKGLMYQKVGNYTYQTVIGSQYSVPAYQATPYKFSDIDKFKVKVKSVGREKIGANYLE